MIRILKEESEENLISLLFLALNFDETEIVIKYFSKELQGKMISLCKEIGDLNTKIYSLKHKSDEDFSSELADLNNKRASLVDDVQDLYDSNYKKEMESTPYLIINNSNREDYFKDMLSDSRGLEFLLSKIGVALRNYESIAFLGPVYILPNGKVIDVYRFMTDFNKRNRQNYVVTHFGFVSLLFKFYMYMIAKEMKKKLKFEVTDEWSIDSFTSAFHLVKFNFGNTNEERRAYMVIDSTKRLTSNQYMVVEHFIDYCATKIHNIDFTVMIVDPQNSFGEDDHTYVITNENKMIIGRFICRRIQDAYRFGRLVEGKNKAR